MNMRRLITIRPTVMIGVERDGMLSLKGIIVLLLCVLFGQPLRAQNPASPGRLYADSTDALYNLDFSTAQRGYETLTRMYPDDPDYWNALASSLWLKMTYEQQKLNIESFSGNASFGTKDSKESVSAADEKRLRDTVATAM